MKLPTVHVKQYTFFGFNTPSQYLWMDGRNSLGTQGESGVLQMQSARRTWITELSQPKTVCPEPG